MWTGWVPYSDSEFRFNHFVPFVPLIKREDAVYHDISDSEESDQTEPLFQYSILCSRTTSAALKYFLIVLQSTILLATKAGE